MRIPQRHNLVTEVVGILREGIQSQRWQGYLPGERELAQALQVSRPTLSKALKTLEREGVLEAQTKSRRRITISHVAKPNRKGAVVLLLPKELETLELHTVLWINRLRANVSGLGREFHICIDKRSFTQNCGVHLARVTQSALDVSCWVVPYTTRGMQNWFMSSKLPLIVVGSCFEGISLHSVDLDFYSVGLHAAGMLLSKGHHFLCMLTTGRPNAGEKLTELGFRNACRAHRSEAVELEIVSHNGSLDGLCRSLARLLDVKGAPTGFLVSGPHETLTLISWMAQRNLRMGVDYALISRSDDTFLSHLTPTVPCYRRDHKKFSVALTRLIQRISSEPNIPPTSVKVLPEFKPGKALMPVSGKYRQG